MTHVTERLYYNDSFLKSFDARVVRVDGKQLVLDRTAFYPSSGGQPFDLGTLAQARVVDVQETEDGEILHVLEAPAAVAAGDCVRGKIDWPRRADHIQQHTGQHLLSAVFERLFQARTVSFHLGDETSTIDLAVPALSAEQTRSAEEMANRIIFEDRPLRVFFASAEEARNLTLRKESAREGKLRLVEIPDLDLSACGGTHAASTGQVGGLMLRKIEKVKQGVRVEFVCGQRAVRAARADFEALADAGAAFTTHPHQVPAAARRQLEELKSAEKERQRILTALAGYEARELFAATPEQNGVRRLSRSFDAPAAYVRVLAAQFAAQPRGQALFLVKEPPTLVLAQSPDLPHDLGAAVKAIAAEFGLHGGGSRHSAQAGAPDLAAAQRALVRLAEQLDTMTT